ncbi:MAG: hypothetical protein Q7R89_01705 [bacterium]|nr:hypothetical protein [bacterium]
MQISDIQLDKFITLYREKFGVELDRQSAYEKGVRLVQLMKTVYKPITKNDYEKYSKEIR